MVNEIKRENGEVKQPIKGWWKYMYMQNDVTYVGLNVLFIFGDVFKLLFQSNKQSIETYSIYIDI